MNDFEARNLEFIERMSRDANLACVSRDWLLRSAGHEYSYHFTWFGRPIIQYPQDILAMQEIIWRIKPDLIIETGVAHGGSLVFYASMLEMIGGPGQVLGVDIEIRPHNRAAIQTHPMFKRIRLIEGSSTDEGIAKQVREIARNGKRILVALDSNHTHDHVLRELQIYAPLVTNGSYLVVFDTIIEHIPEMVVAGRPWGKGNNPKTALEAFLKTTDRFEVDREIDAKLLITVAPGGYLKCVREMP